MMKKILLVIMLLILATSVQGAFTTQVAGTIGTLTGVSSLDGSALTVSITSTDGGSTYVSGSVASGTYSPGMTLLSSPVSLNYSSTYTYKLHVNNVGDFMYNFTTPASPGSSGAQLHTGQTTSYATGDDANTDGTAKSMIRTEPVPGEGIVTDAHTGLIWQDGDNGQTDTWANSISYCNNLNWGGYATGWRLPNKLEWETVMDNERNDWNMWPAVFQSRATNYYWTSTSLSSNSAFAYNVNMYTGFVDVDDKTLDDNLYARCVHDQ